MVCAALFWIADSAAPPPVCGFGCEFSRLIFEQRKTSLGRFMVGSQDRHCPAVIPATKKPKEVPSRDFQFSLSRPKSSGWVYALNLRNPRRKANGRSPACLAVEAGRLLRWAVA